MFKGSIDAVHNGRCYGWAMDTQTPSFIDVEVFIDGESIGRSTASGYRADLERPDLVMGGLPLRRGAGGIA
jgi:hypothetical protein